MLSPVTHVIWDCDGCLIDSEIIACRIEAKTYTRLGYPTTTEDYIRRFAGQNDAAVFQLIKQESGIDLTGQINEDDLRREILNAFETELQAVTNIHQTLAAIKLPMAVASGSSPERLAHSLKLTNLWDFFNGHIYSSTMVPHGKPAPDVFLLAAHKLNAKPANCLVIEDGVHGVIAARNAGMQVIGFTGASHGSPALAQRLTEAGGALILSDITQLNQLLA